MTAWPTGPQTACHLAQWCEAHDTPVQHVLSAMTPPLARSTIKRWKEGAFPERGTLERLQHTLDHWDEDALSALLGDA